MTSPNSGGMGRRLSHPQPQDEKEERCLTFNAKNSTGAGASSCWKPAASPVRPTAPCWPPGAKPPCSRPSSQPKEAKPGQDFFPLTVNYQEKAFAAGRIPGGYLKREGRPSDRETLTSRLIDRPIRPLFPDNFRCETQVIATVFSYDLEIGFGHPGDDRLFGGADPIRRAVHGPDRRGARRRHQGRRQGQPDGRGDEGFRRSTSSSPARPMRF